MSSLLTRPSRDRKAAGVYHISFGGWGGGPWVESSNLPWSRPGVLETCSPWSMCLSCRGASDCIVRLCGACQTRITPPQTRPAPERPLLCPTCVFNCVKHSSWLSHPAACRSAEDDRHQASWQRPRKQTGGSSTALWTPSTSSSLMLCFSVLHPHRITAFHMFPIIKAATSTRKSSCYCSKIKKPTETECLTYFNYNLLEVTYTLSHLTL